MKRNNLLKCWVSSSILKERLFFLYLAAYLAPFGVLAAADGGSDAPFTVDERVTPIRLEIKKFQDQTPRLVAEAAVATAKVAKNGEKASDTMEVDAHRVPYRDSLSPKTLDQFAWLADTFDRNCGYLLQQEMGLLRQAVNDGPNAALAEQKLQQQIPDDDCTPPPPTFDLVDGLVLPEVDAGSEVFFVLQPPASIPQNFTADIVSAQGNFVSQGPLGGTLYNGTLYLRTDGKQLGLSTPDTFVLPECARTETFTIRLTHANGVADFDITLPVRLEHPGMGIRTYSVNPGQNVNFRLCAAGDRGAMQWNWIQHSGDPFPPPGLSLVTYPDGDAAITGTAQAGSYAAQGAFQVQQGSSVAVAGVQFLVDVDFAIVLGTECAQHRVTPDAFFQCELPRPVGYNYNSGTWTLAGGALPAGVSLVQRGPSWYLEGTVPYVSSACPICDAFDTVGLYPLDFDLTVTGFNGVAATRQVTLDVGIPFDAWTQNTILRPSGNPLVANTGDDNAERAQMILDRVNTGTFDIIALQEVFDEEQRDELVAGYDGAQYGHVWGPDEDDIEEESGLALLVQGSGDWSLRQSQLHGSNHNEVFGDCAGVDCLANKGFSVTPVRFGFSHPVWVVNTHMQAAYDFDDQHSNTRRNQLQQIMDYVATLPATDPVILVGDLNVVAGQTEYNDRLADVLGGWQDPVEAFGNAALPFITADSTRNAYNHFWHDEHHIREHELEDIANQDGPVICLQVAGTLSHPCSPPIPHPAEQKRLDHVLIRQGTEYQLEVDAVRLEDAPRTTELCRDRFQPQYQDPGHGSLQCYLSDHFGLSATLRLVRHP